MVPLVVLVVVAAVSRLVGALAVDHLSSGPAALRVGLAVMLVLTGSAHFGSRRADLVAMVPPRLPAPSLLVTLTGIAELVIAAALLVPAAARWSAAALVVLLIAMFPANVRAARARIGIGGRPPTPIGLRAAIQVAFVASAVVVATA